MMPPWRANKDEQQLQQQGQQQQQRRGPSGDKREGVLARIGQDGKYSFIYTDDGEELFAIPSFFVTLRTPSVGTRVAYATMTDHRTDRVRARQVTVIAEDDGTFLQPYLLRFDWKCGCGDAQFAKNRFCRTCGAERPPPKSDAEQEASSQSSRQGRIECPGQAQGGVPLTGPDPAARPPLGQQAVVPAQGGVPFAGPVPAAHSSWGQQACVSAQGGAPFAGPAPAAPPQEVCTPAQVPVLYSARSNSFVYFWDPVTAEASYLIDHLLGKAPNNARQAELLRLASSENIQRELAKFYAFKAEDATVGVAYPFALQGLLASGSAGSAGRNPRRSRSPIRAPQAGVPAAAPDQLDSLTVRVLKTRLREAGLKLTGLKQDPIDRLRDHLAATAPAPPTMIYDDADWNSRSLLFDELRKEVGHESRWLARQQAAGRETLRLGTKQVGPRLVQYAVETLSD
eukprot:TRINITY_DN87977_c0_g1_i1.p1 TRINITY_DN87977_c0_g1~~TRINITY_DN87977_c0_g1_i1.p1  ORF type:complete len:455 (+),score=75.31 TRINITY_DN87977_c0_g1_i1:1107-2471(+)